MTDFPVYVAAFVGVIGVLVFIHELGHFAAARYCGVKVLRFSVGFGPVIGRYQQNSESVEWVLGLIPLGGYVKMLDEREGPVSPERMSEAFNRQSVGARSLIVAAGPLANLALAIVLYWLVFLVGSEALAPILGTPSAGTFAASSGINNGDLVRAVNGEPVATWNDFRWEVTQRIVDRQAIHLSLEQQNGKVKECTLTPLSVVIDASADDPLQQAGLVFYRPEIPAIIGKVSEGTPAAREGVLPGDRVVSVNQIATPYWGDFVQMVRAAPGQLIKLEILRQGVRHFIDVVPDGVQESGKTQGKIGVALGELPPDMRNIRVFVRYGPVDAGFRAIKETWEQSKFSLVMMGRMLRGELSWKNLSGPVTIADYAGQSAKAGVDYYLRFMALVSISLGILNLLPVPVLDGGHLMYHILEVIRRKPLSERMLGISQRIGMLLLVALMAFALFNDLSRLFNG